MKQLKGSVIPVFNFFRGNFMPSFINSIIDTVYVNLWAIDTNKIQIN
jgi:hypothetical protein